MLTGWVVELSVPGSVPRAPHERPSVWVPEETEPDPPSTPARPSLEMRRMVWVVRESDLREVSFFMMDVPTHRSADVTVRDFRAAVRRFFGVRST